MALYSYARLGLRRGLQAFCPDKAWPLECLSANVPTTKPDGPGREPGNSMSIGPDAMLHILLGDRAEEARKQNLQLLREVVDPTALCFSGEGIACLK